MLLLVPPAALCEHAADVYAVFRRRAVRLLLHHQVLEAQSVDRDRVLPCEVLHRSGHEGVHEEEARQPEDRRLVRVDPLLEHGDPCQQIGEETSQRLQRGIRFLGPQGRDLVGVESDLDLLQVGRHDYQALESLAEVDEGGPDHIDQRVVTDELLREDSVHALLELDGKLLEGLLSVEGVRQLLQHLLCKMIQSVALRSPARPPPRRVPGLGLQHSVAEIVGFLLVLGDVGVLVEAEDLRLLGQGELQGEVDQLLVARCAGSAAVDA
mmetsp:Transcript_36169/g.112972  ORF Transcript_36169/g.112972 Transcript_36169/m.112972 type:complete len:267 (-) Transcript_36169:2951-3751(-)